MTPGNRYQAYRAAKEEVAGSSRSPVSAIPCASKWKAKGAGDSTELICDAGWFADGFTMHLDKVREATLVFTREGYRTASLRVTVPRRNGGPRPVVIDDAVIVMHREETTP